MYKSPINRYFPVPTHCDAAIILQPRDGSFHNPSMPVSPQLTAILSLGLSAIYLMRTNQLEATIFKAVSQWVGIIRSISHNIAFMIFRQRSFIKCYFDEFRLVRGRACHVHSDRKTLAARHHHKLCTFSTFGLTHAGAPFFAGENVPSIKMFIQFNWPSSSSSWMRAIHACSQTPWSSQSRSRRQHVLEDGKRSGRSFHRAPLRSTQRMPSKHARLFAGGRPPLDERLGCGRSCSTFFHWFSFINSSLAIALIPFNSQVLHKFIRGASLKLFRF